MYSQYLEEMNRHGQRKLQKSQQPQTMIQIMENNCQSKETCTMLNIMDSIDQRNAIDLRCLFSEFCVLHNFSFYLLQRSESWYPKYYKARQSPSRSSSKKIYIQHTMERCLEKDEHTHINIVLQ